MNDEKTILSRAFGLVDYLYWYPTSGHCTSQLNAHRWRLAYQHDGLAFGVEHGDAAVLRSLTRDGYLTATGGKTKAAAHKLTLKGLAAVLPDGGPTLQDVVGHLKRISKMAGPNGWVAGYQICRTAAGWVLRGDRESYADETADAECWMIPAQIAGWIEQTTVEKCLYWSATITDAGHQAMSDAPPDYPTGTHFDYDAWTAGRERGKLMFERQAPERYRRVVPYSSGPAMWEGVYKFSGRKTRSGQHKPPRLRQKGT